MNRTNVIALLLISAGVASVLAAPPPEPKMGCGLEGAPPPRPVNLADQPKAAGPIPPPVWGIPPDERLPEAVALDACPTGGEVLDWGVAQLHCRDAWKRATGKGTRVAVLDTGCDPNHRDLRGKVGGAKDFTGSASGYADVQGHGTHCATTCLAAKNDDGTIGVAHEATLLIGKVLGDRGSGSVVGIAAGIRWAVAEGADVISMSLGGPGADNYIPPALAEAEAAGVIVVAAAGNEGPGANTCGYPGRYKVCVAVAATDPADRVASFSSRCGEVFLGAPGVQIRAGLPGDRFGTMSGTSMATPHVAGLAALWCEANPGVPKKQRPAAFRAALQAACADLAPTGRDTATGYGLPDAAKLVGTGPTPPPVEPPPPKPMPGVVLDLDSLTPDARKRFLDVFPGGSLRIELPAGKP